MRKRGDCGDTFEVLSLDRKTQAGLISESYQSTTDPFLLDPFAEFASGDWIRARRMMACFGITDMRLSPFILDEGLSLLHLAARFGLREATATLLAWGVRVDALAWPRSETGARWRALTEGLPVNLVGYGRGAFGLTPLHLAILTNDEAMIRYLLASGANPRRRFALDGGPEGDWGWTPIDLSKRVAETGQNNTKVVVLLREAEQHAAEPIENKWLPVE